MTASARIHSFVLGTITAILASIPCGRNASAQEDCGPDWSALGAGVDGSVVALATFDDGTGPALYAGGHFDMAGGVPASHVARWDGMSWSALGAGLDAEVTALEVFDGGSGPELYAGGRFRQAGGVATNGIARWNGAGWATVGAGGVFFTSTLGVRGLGTVDAMAVFDDGTGPALYVSGFFTDAGGVDALRLARWDGAAWSSVGSTSRSLQVMELEAFDDGSGPALYAGGSFSSIGGVPARNVARFDGSSWSALGTDSLAGFVSAMAPFDGGLAIGGFISSVEGQPAGNVVRWDGAALSPLGGGVDGNVFALAAFDDGFSGPALYAGGLFTVAGGAPAGHVARWDGSSWSPLGPGVGPGEPQALLAVTEARGDSALVVGGTFSFAGGEPVGRIARWGRAGMTLDVSTLRAGEVARFDVGCATPLQRTFLVYSLRGPGMTPVARLGVTIDLESPRLGAILVADAARSATLSRRVPASAAGRMVWLQAVERGRKSPVAAATVD